MLLADSGRSYYNGRGEGGCAQDFMQKSESPSHSEAIRRLDCSQTAAPGDANRPSGPRRSRFAELPPRGPDLLTEAAHFYAEQLQRCSEARAYLASQGLAPAAAGRLGLGYGPGDGLQKAMESLGFSKRHIRDSGLFMDRGAERFAGMIVVPDFYGRLVRWLVGRAVDPEARPRFQALPDPKPVLGLGRLGLAPSWAIVTESVLDWLTLTGWDYPACAAVGEQGLEQTAAALRGCARVFLAFASDDAGREAARRLGALLGRRAAMVTLPRGAGDIADLAALPDGRAAFRRLLLLAAITAR